MGEHKRSRRLSKGGFTLVELLIVLAIIALLISILLPAITAVRRAATATQCGSNLRQLFIAQSFYHDAWKRYTPVRIHSDPHHRSWPMRLAPLIDRSLRGDPEVPSQTVFREKVWAARGALSVLHCPAEPAESLGDSKYSYGLNPFTQMPAWAGRRDRRAPMSELILMADKPVGTQSQDFLITEDGLAFYYGSAFYKFIYRYPKHSNFGAHRHAARRDPARHLTDDFNAGYDPAGANAVFADGHVRRVSRHALRGDSGHWYFTETNSLPIVEFPGADPCCQ